MALARSKYTISKADQKIACKKQKREIWAGTRAQGGKNTIDYWI